MSCSALALLQRKAKKAELGFLTRVPGICLRDKVRSSVIREELKAELLLLCVKRSQLSWFRHLARKPSGKDATSLARCSRHVQLGGGPGADPGPGGGIISLHWHWEHLGIPQSELVDVAREREVWGPLLKLLPSWPDPKEVADD